MTIEFDADLHEYRVDGRVWPGVTRLLQTLHSFAGVPPWVLQTAQERGDTVHRLCQLDDEEDLADAEEWERGEFGGYLRAWRSFREKYAPQWEFIEIPMAHRGLGYCGTPDRIGHITTPDGVIVPCVLDIKTSARAHPVWGLQLEAYRMMVCAQSDEMRATYEHAHRYTVRLTANGDYMVDPWVDALDSAVFLSLLNLFRWKEKHD